jgi:uncharacterized protein (DUF2252 family)
MTHNSAKIREPGDRLPELERRRALKMASSTHAYVRGNTRDFYRWLAASGLAETVPQGPPVWICGDCHLGNLGPLADAQGAVDIQIRDLDQTVIGNPAHDLIRLGLSLATAARGADLPGVTTARMIEQMVEGYELALTGDGADPLATEPDVVRAVRRRALGRRWKHLARERLVDTLPVIPRGKKFWPLFAAERKALDALFEREDVRAMILKLSHREEDEPVRLIDAAYWVKGCSSLGTLRYAVLAGVGGSRKSPDSLALVDLKEAVETVAPVAPGWEMPQDYGLRVAAGARSLSPNLGERMLPVGVLGKPMVMRELMPQDLKIEIGQFSRKEAMASARYLAHVVGKAHARQMDEAMRESWRATLLERRGGALDAPSWLWRCVVDLMAAHEIGYLEHCRRYALAREE